MKQSTYSPTHRRWMLAVTMLVGSVTACGSGSSASETLVGQWAVRSKAATIQDLPVVGKQPSVTTALMTAEIKSDGADGLVMTQKLCNITISGGSTTIDDNIPRTTPPTTAALRVTQEGDIVKWSRAETISLIGVNLTDVANEALPEMPDDPRVFDQDTDGKPGVTVRVMTQLFSGEAYVVQRQRLSFTGSQTGPDKLSGQTINRSEQVPVDATNSYLKTKIATTPDDANSTVEVARLQVAYDCDRVKAEAATLFF